MKLVRRAYVLATIVGIVCGAAALRAHVPIDDVEKIVDFHGRTQEIGQRAAWLELTLAGGTQDEVHQAMLALVREWLALYAEFFAHETAQEAKADAGRLIAVEVNQSLSAAFRQCARGDHSAIAPAIEKLDDAMPTLDRLIGVPDDYYWLARLRGVYRSYLQGSDQFAGAVGQRYLLERLAVAAARARSIAQQKGRPQELDEAFSAIRNQLDAVRAVDREQRKPLLERQIQAISEQLLRLDAQLGRPKDPLSR